MTKICIRFIISRCRSMHKTTQQYWEKDDLNGLENVETIAETFAIAERVLNRMPDCLGQVCGPMNNGGRGNLKDNMEVFRDMVHHLHDKGIILFDQLPFEDTFHRLTRGENPTQTYQQVIDDFYELLYHTGKVRTLYFIPGWKTSNGARWEYNRAKELGMEIVEL
jgi:hypothetical protein